jgi:hemerythrin-like domain-containing protein
LSQDYTSPDGACPTFRAFYAGLHEFEQDLHQHIHLENNILFPRAVALEASTAWPVVRSSRGTEASLYCPNDS